MASKANFLFLHRTPLVAKFVWTNAISRKTSGISICYYNNSFSIVSLIGLPAYLPDIGHHVFVFIRQIAIFDNQIIYGTLKYSGLRVDAIENKLVRIIFRSTSHIKSYFEKSWYEKNSRFVIFSNICNILAYQIIVQNLVGLGSFLNHFSS